MPPREVGHDARGEGRSRRKSKAVSCARLGVFERGMIWGMHLAGTRREDIRKHVAKTDGTDVSVKIIDKVVAKRKADPKWTGQDAGGGKLRALAQLTVAGVPGARGLLGRARGHARAARARVRVHSPEGPGSCLRGAPVEAYGRRQEGLGGSGVP